MDRQDQDLLGLDDSGTGRRPFMADESRNRSDAPMMDSFLGSEPVGAGSSTAYRPFMDEFDDSASFDHLDGASTQGDDYDILGSRRYQRHSGMPIQSGLAGVYDRVRDAFGAKRDYSEMDLPLTNKPANGGSRDEPNAQLEPPSSRRRRRRRSSVISGFTFGLFGRSRGDENLGPRVIHLNNAPANHAGRFVGNHVSTAKYNVITFIPKFFFEQFSRYANLFFLITSLIQQVPNVSPTNRFTTIGTLAVVLMVSAFKELIEDVKRHRSDTELNQSPAEVLVGADFEPRKWIDLHVGDIIRVKSEEPVPADLILIASSEPEGLCYIETANLDGETNLKVKQAIPETAHLVSPGDLGRLSGKVRSEQPNSSLYTFEASITIDYGSREKEYPLNPGQLLLRGATMRNTPWVYGMVVFTGHETKLMRNATAAPIKRTDVEKQVNVQILFLFGILIVLSIISSAGDVIIQAVRGSQLSYIMEGGINGAKLFFSDILTYWVLYSNLVPISLFVTVELVKYCHAYLINSDLDMYYEARDTPAVCRTSSLVEELGQIEYIFSDKTGTLTCNQMDFQQCSIAGICYSVEVPEDRKATVVDGQEFGIHDFATLRENLASHRSREIIDAFLTLLATCHTVIPERSEKSAAGIKYQAASPDEGALVQGAADLGYRFTVRRPKSVTIEIGLEEKQYEVLNICEFNSTRKRMSCILRCPDGKIRLFCKGADTVILERLSGRNPYVDVTLQHLEEYATDGLRTLCLAVREIPEAEYKRWSAVYDKAATTINNRERELDKAAEIIEKDLFLLGATAIEDRLQDGVPDTIHTLQTAGIKVWVLTGDRQETAINIGMSCKLISEDMNLIIVNEDSKEATHSLIKQKLRVIKEQQTTLATEVESLALIIDGKNLSFALDKDVDGEFLDLAVKCKAVICCRVSPLQKALVVKLVKRNLHAILLAIGDGANDVGMIQAAHVGVGISGMEGLQAARSADVSIGQFRFLKKLLLVHGAWSYQRLSKVILYSFYKNIALHMTQFWYVFKNGFSGQVIFESWTISFYNVFFTVLPPLSLGIFDQMISARLLDRYPQLYRLGQKGVFFDKRSFWSWILNGFYHSLLLYIGSSYTYQYDGPASDGQLSGHWVWGAALYTAALATVLGKAALVTNLWTKYSVVAIPGSFLFWLGFVAVYGTVAPMVNVSVEYLGVIPRLYRSPVFWAMILLLPAMCLLRDFAWKYAKRMYYPIAYHHVQEIQKYNIADYRPRMEQFQKAIRKVRQTQRMRKQRGFAFSQADEGQLKLIRAYDTTQRRGRYGEMRANIPDPI